jgi:predicted TIM-barrel fold metal-dependent hydrolase
MRVGARCFSGIAGVCHLRAAPVLKCAQPRATTSKPRYAVPPNGCDTHFHVYGPRSIYPVPADHEFDPPDTPEDRVRAMHAALGIDRGVIVDTVLFHARPSYFLDTLRAHPDRYRGLAMVGDMTTDADLHELDSAGVRGARFYFYGRSEAQWDLPGFVRSAKRVAEFGWHVDVHISSQQIVTLAPLLLSLDMPVVIDHIGHPEFDEGTDGAAFRFMLDLLRHKNIWIKASSGDRRSRKPPPYEDAIPFYRAIARAAPDRTLWGTNWPHVLYKYVHKGQAAEPMPDEGDLLNLLFDSVADAHAAKRILVDHPARLYGFDH